ncbi:hypothetical protein EJ06DRAFT_525845 [Trichodelitschia bisporula]|uniref:Uncharacterized protein n=1 Tax=Trichodelitschia bisporula TaxID=703511 RepID=A0A6G1IB74_9PEZI|nr:hypothetical protein EJ06DRAFT_525845 [Trichodelitschia bisporula]
MAPPAVDQVNDLVKSYEKHPEQGLKAIKKRLAKDARNPVLLIAQAKLLLRLGRPDDALTSLQQIVPTKPPAEPIDVQLVAEVMGTMVQAERDHGTYKHIAGPHVWALWADILDRRPKTRDVRNSIVSMAAEDGYWDVAQQFYARMQKEHPKVADFHFYWVAYSQLLGAVKEDGGMMKMLASRSLKAAIDSVRAKKDTPRRIQNEQHLRLLTAIYMKQGLYEELVDVLVDPDIGIESPVGKNDVEFIRLKLQALGRQGKWRDLYDLLLSAHKSYLVAQSTNRATKTGVQSLNEWIDSFSMWDILLTATQFLGDEKAKDEVINLLLKYLEHNERSRNPGIAMLRYHVIFDKADLLRSCEKFFDVHSGHRSCYEDLVDYVLELPEQQRSQLSTHIKQAAAAVPLVVQKSLPSNGEDTDSKDSECKETDPEGESKMADVTDTDLAKLEISKKKHEAKPEKPESLAFIYTNALKFEYLVGFAPLTSPPADAIKAFASRCAAYNPLIKEANPDAAGDATLLGILAQLHLASSLSSTSPAEAETLRLTALHTLTRYREHDPHNYEGTLLHIHLTLLLGLVPQALKSIAHLALREIQYDTVAPIFYARLSTLHPHPTPPFRTPTIRTPETRKSDPAAALSFATNWHPLASFQFGEAIGKGVVTFDKLFEVLDLKASVESSISRAIFAIELRRIARLLGPFAAVDDVQLVRWYDVSDELPTAKTPTLPAFGRPLAGWPEDAFRACEPRRVWVAWMSAVDIVASALTTKTPVSPTHAKHLADARSFVYENQDAKEEQLSADEKASEALMRVFVKEDRKGTGNQFSAAEKAAVPAWEGLMRVAAGLGLVGETRGVKDVDAGFEDLAAWLKGVKMEPRTVLPGWDEYQTWWTVLEVLRVTARACELAAVKKVKKVEAVRTVAREVAQGIVDEVKEWKGRVEKLGEVAGVIIERGSWAKDVVEGALDGMKGVEGVAREVLGQLLGGRGRK